MDCIFVATSPTSPAGDSPVVWVAPGQGSRSLGLGECAGLLEGRPVALVLPAEMTSALRVSLPTRKARLMRQALPYVVEEMLADDVEHFHLSLGEPGADGRYPVLAILKAQLANWLDTLELSGITVAAIHVDADLLPQDGEQTLLLGDRLLIGGEAEVRMAVSQACWPQLSPFCGGSIAPRAEPDPYALLAGGRATAIDLAQGDFRLRTETTAWPLWRPFALLSAAAVILLLAFNVVQVWLLERSGDDYAQASRALYQELFPEDSRIVNIRAQFAAHLEQKTPESSFMSLLGLASPSIAGAKSPLVVAQVDYSQSRGDLVLQVRARDFADLEQLRQRLTESGLSVQVGSASREEQGVTARVVLRGGA